MNMGIFKSGINIGKAIADRVTAFPVGEKKPKKKSRGKSSTCWVHCPDFRVKMPKVVSQAAAEKDYSFTIKISSETRKECLKALDYMISCGRDEEIEAGSKRFWLHAVTYGIRHEGLFLAELTYIFRVRQIPEEIS